MLNFLDKKLPHSVFEAVLVVFFFVSFITKRWNFTVCDFLPFVCRLAYRFVSIAIYNTSFAFHSVSLRIIALLFLNRTDSFFCLIKTGKKMNDVCFF